MKKHIIITLMLSLLFSSAAFAESTDENIIYSNSFSYGLGGVSDFLKTAAAGGYEIRNEDRQKVLAVSLGMGRDGASRSVCAQMGKTDGKDFNLYVKMRAQQTKTVDGLILFNINSGTSYYALRVGSDGVIKLCKSSISQEMGGATGKLPADALPYYRNSYKITVTDGTVEVYINGAETPAISTADSEPITGGSIALGAVGSTYAPAEIIFSDLYVTDGKENNVLLTLGNSAAYTVGSPLYINGGEFKRIDENNPDVAPFIENDRAMIPLRTLSESLGFEVFWDNGKITLQKSGKTLTLQSGSDICYTDGKEIKLTNAVMIKHDRSYIPLRSISEMFGKNVLWRDSGVIIIADVNMEDKVSDNLAENITKIFGKPE